MKKIFLLIFISSNLCNAFSQNDLSGTALFDTTLVRILNYSSIFKESNGPLAGNICDDVVKIVYFTPDSIISKQKKMEIIHIMLYFQRYSSNKYRAIIRRAILDGDTIFTRDLSYALPFAICYYCEYELLSRVLQNEDYILMDDLDEDFIYYLNILILNMKNVLAESKKHKKTPYKFHRQIIKKQVIKSNKFLKNYPEFYLYRDHSWN